jgi:hypothetical protein
MKSSYLDLFFSLFAYNEQTGALTWKRNNIEAGWEENGYRRVEVEGEKYFVHHITNGRI